MYKTHKYYGLRIKLYFDTMASILVLYEMLRNFKKKESEVDTDAVMVKSGS